MMAAIVIPIESEGSSFSEVLSNLGFLTRKVFWKNHRVSFYKKSNPLKANSFKRAHRLEWEKQMRVWFCFEKLRALSDVFIGTIIAIPERAPGLVSYRASN